MIGKMCAVLPNNSMGEGVGISVLEMGLNVSTHFKPQVCYRIQRV